MRAFVGAALAACAFLTAPAAVAQEALPDKRMVMTQNRDFAGTDLQQLFDTTFDACRNACEADDACVAFTFNTRNNSCFPKSSVTGEVEYEGADSARITPVPDAARALGAARAADLDFLGEAAINNARRLAEQISWLHPAGQYSVDEMLEAARARVAQDDKLNAMRWMGGAVSKSDASDQWAEFARLLVEVSPEKASDRRTYRSRAVSAATNAYLRADRDPARVAALQVLAEALEETEQGRRMIPALRLAERIQPREDIVAALDRAIGLYGFRIAEHEVEHNIEMPRLCVEFTEPLAKAGID